jgi:hypothetical protein
MFKYIITTSSDQVEIDNVMSIKASSDEEAQTMAQAIVDEYNSLENGHSTGWTLKSVVKGILPPEENIG